MVCVVLGMHKSGTTLVAELLHRSGIPMLDGTDPAAGYDDGNKWERESTKAINHEILGSAGAYSLAVTRRGRGRPPLDRMRALVGELSQPHTDWGFKDPRTCLTYDAWATVLPAHHIVAVYREPATVWTHYWRSATGGRSLVVLRDCLRSWCTYNTAILDILARTTVPFIVIDYAELMGGDTEFGRLQQFIGRPLTDPRDPRMNRSRPAEGGLYRFARGLHLLAGGPRPETIAARLADLRK